MRRRLLSGLMAFCMALSLFPARAYGTDMETLYNSYADDLKAAAAEAIREANAESSDEPMNAADELTEGADETAQIPDAPTEGADETAQIPDAPAEGADETAQIPDAPTEGADEAAQVPDEPAEGADEAAQVPDEPAEDADEAAQIPDAPTEDADETAQIPDEPTEGADETAQIPDAPTEGADETAQIPDAPTEDADETAQIPDEPTEGADETAQIPDAPTEDADETAQIPDAPTEDAENAYQSGSKKEDAALLGGDILASGSCGANLKWHYDAENTLTFEGSGTMTNYLSGRAPWYNYRSAIAAVVIPEGVTSIGNYAFYSCSALKTVNIPKGVESIGTYAFSGCSALETVNIPESVTSIGTYAFSGCSALKTVAIPKGVTSIAASAFSGCSALTTANLPEGLTSIGTYAFSGCSALTALTIPASVSAFGNGAFYNCTNLLLTVFRGSPGRNYAVTSGYRHVIAGEENPVVIKRGGSLGNTLIWMLYENGTLSFEGSGAIPNYSSSSSSRAPWYNYRSEITAVVIPKDVTAIGNYAFHSCSALKTASLAEGATSIGTYAFYGCSALETVAIPESVTSIGDYAFSGCSALKTVAIPKGVASIGTYAFSGCSALTALNLPESLTSIGNYAFSGCSALTALTIPASVKTFGNSVFYNCANLLLTVFRGSPGRTYAVTSGYRHVIAGDENPVAIKRGGSLGDALLWMLYENGTLSFDGSGAIPNYSNSSSSRAPWYNYRSEITAVVVPKGVTAVGNYAFYACSKLKTASLAEGVASIGTYAFSGCSELTTANLPESVTSIGAYAFSGCSALTALTIPVKAQTFGNGAFSNCTNLLLTVFRGSPGRNYAATSGYRHVISGDENPVAIKRGGSLGDALLWTLSENGALSFEGSGAIPNYSTSSSNRAPWYNYQSEIAAVVVPKGVTAVGAYAFYGCSKLKTASLAEGVASIGDYAFSGCSALTALNFPESLTSIGAYAFSGCSALTALTIPSSVKTFGNSAFYNCANLLLTVFRGSPGNTYAAASGYRHVISGEENPVVIQRGGSLGDALLWTLYENGTLSFEGSGAIPNYSNSSSSAAPWYNYRSAIAAVVIPKGVTSIGDYAFYACSKLKTASLAEGVASIGNYAFSGCPALETVVIPESVASIGSYAFSGCSALTALTIPVGVKTFGNSAFYNCLNLLLTVFRNSPGRTYAATSGYRHVIADDKSDAVIKRGGSCGSSLLWMIYEDNTLVFEGSGAMENYFNSSYGAAPWYNYRSAIASVSIPEGVTSIGNCAFSGCSALTTLKLPEGLTSIGASAFSGCSALTALTIPAKTQSIGSNAFYGCDKLLLTVFPDSEGRKYAIQNGRRHVLASSEENPKPLTVLNSGSCGTSLSWLLYENNALVLEGSGDMSSYSSNGAPWRQYREQIKTISLPDGLTSIGNYAFQGLTSLETVSIPESVTKLGNGAFHSCASLKSLNIPQSAASVGNDCFSGCAALTLTVLRGSYGRRHAIKNNLPYATPGETRKITAQGSCGDTLCWILFEDGTLELEGYGNMYGRNAPKDVPWYAQKDSVKSLSIPEGVTGIGSRAFYECANLSAVKLPESLKSIGDYAFHKCASLKTLLIPKDVSSISANAFSECPDLTLTVIRGSDGRTYAIKRGLRHVVSDAPQSVIAASGSCGDNLLWLFYEDGTLAFEGSGNMYNYSMTNAHTTAPWYARFGEITAVSIPEGVTRIGSYAFYGNAEYALDYRFSNVKSVALPSSVTAIGDRAFYQCVGLTSVTIPENLASIGEYAFYGCEGLTALSIPTVTNPIGANAFANCPKLTLKVYAGSYAQDYAIKNSIRHVTGEGPAILHSGSCGDKMTWALYENGVLAFSGSGAMRNYAKKASDSPWTTAPWLDYRDQISSVTISEGVTSLGAYAFYGGMDYAKDFRFANLKSVSLPSTLTVLGDHAFESCVGLVSLSLPDGLSAIGAYTFANCSALSNLTTPKEIAESNPSETAAASEEAEKPPRPKNPLPENLNSIGESAFYACSSLTELTIPKGVKPIGNNAFAKCDNLTVTVYPGSYAAEEYVLRNNVKHIVWGASGPGVTESGVCGDNLKWLLYEDGTLTFQGTGAMQNYNKKSSTSPNTTAPWYAYKDTISNVIIPDGVTSIGSYAFYGDKYYDNDYRFSKLTSVKIPDSIKTVGAYAFYGCANLSQIALSSSLESIGERAFSGCESLTEIVIPQGLLSIGANAFADCSGLTLKCSQESYARDYAIQNGLRHVTLENPNEIAIAGGPCGTNNSGTSSNLYWILYESGKFALKGSGEMRDYSSNNHHTTAPWHSHCDRIVSLDIPDGVTKIGAYAFYGLKYFEEDYRFTKLASITIPNSVTKIGSYAFQNCTALTDLTISPYVASIGSQAFADCYNLTLTVYKDSDGNSTTGRTYALQSGLRHTLYGENRTVTVCGSCGDYGSALYWMLYTDGKLEFEGSGKMRDYSGNRYKTDAPWSLYRNEIVAVKVPEGVTRIGSYAFYGALYYAKDYRFSKITSFSLPESLKEIGSHAFSGCTGLPALDISDNVNSIGSYAFSGCAALASVHVPDSLSTIPSYAFSNCSGLVKLDITESVTKIQEGAFSGCSALPTLLIPKTVKTFGNDVFANCRNLTLSVYNESAARNYAASNKLRYRIIETDELVPGDNDDGDTAPITPVVTPPDPFDVTRDAYAFVNQASSFKYSGGDYPIPYDPSFKLIFGDSVAGKSKYKQTSMGAWGGNCNGFSSTVALMYAGIGVTPASFNKSDAHSLVIDDKSAQNISVKTFIEAMQVAQYTDTFAKDYQGNKRMNAQLASGKTLNELIETVENSVSQGKCVIIAVGKQGVGAHALLAYRMETVSANERRMYLYDCNFPNEVRTAKLTGTNGSFTHWTYEMCAPYGEWGTEGDNGSRCFISFIPFETIRYIWENRGSMYQSKEMLSVNVSNLSIQDSSGKEVAKLQDGQLITDSAEIFEVPELSMKWSDTNSIYLPKDMYKIVTTDSQELKATMTDRNLEAEVTTSSDNVTFAVDDASRENTVFIDGMTEQDTYDVNLSSSFADAQYETLSVSGTGSAGMQGGREDTISISGAKDSLALSSNITYNRLAINGDDKNTQYAISAIAGEGGAISPAGDVLVRQGEPQSFAFIPNPGYKVSSVEVDGVKKGAISSYIFPAVNVDGHRVAAYFEKAYEIREASFDASSKTVTVTGLMSLGASTLTAMAFEQSGKFVASASEPVAANAESASVKFDADLPEKCAIKLVLMDESQHPLCNPLKVG